MIYAKYILLIAIIINFSLYSMQSTGEPCYLAYLPEDIHDHIASYLTFHKRESDDEFIARTRIARPILPEHQKLFAHKTFPNIHDSSAGTVRTYSIDGSKIISLKKLTNPQVTIFDIATNTIREHKKFSPISKENTTNIVHIALSQTGCDYAQVSYSQTDYEGLMLFDCWLTVHNIFFNTIKKFPISEYYGDIISIGFNKQGTKIIVHGRNAWSFIDKEHPERWHHMFLLTSPEQHAAKTTQTLAAYLLEYCCCKNLTQNKEK